MIIDSDNCNFTEGCQSSLSAASSAEPQRVRERAAKPRERREVKTQRGAHGRRQTPALACRSKKYFYFFIFFYQIHPAETFPGEPSCSPPCPAAKRPWVPRTPQPRQPTSDIKAGSGQDATVPAVAHQVVPRLLLGAVEAGEGHAERGGAEGGVGGGGQAPAVQGPVQVLGAQVEVGADRAGGGQRGADQQGGVLGGNHCRVCSQKIKKK